MFTLRLSLLLSRTPGGMYGPRASILSHSLAVTQQPTHNFCHGIKKRGFEETQLNVWHQTLVLTKIQTAWCSLIALWLSDGAQHSGCHLTPLWILWLLLRRIFLLQKLLCSKAWIDKLVPESISVTCIAVLICNHSQLSADSILKRNTHLSDKQGYIFQIDGYAML